MNDEEILAWLNDGDVDRAQDPRIKKKQYTFGDTIVSAKITPVKPVQTQANFTKSDVLSAKELGDLLTTNNWGFALGMLLNVYQQAVHSDRVQAAFIRADVKRFVEERGRDRFRNINYTSIQDFIDKCLSLKDELPKLHPQDYDTQRYLRMYHGVEHFIEVANEYCNSRSNGADNSRAGYFKEALATGCDCDPLNEKNYCICGKAPRRE